MKKAPPYTDLGRPQGQEARRPDRHHRPGLRREEQGRQRLRARGRSTTCRPADRPASSPAGSTRPINDNGPLLDFAKANPDTRSSRSSTPASSTASASRRTTPTPPSCSRSINEALAKAKSGRHATRRATRSGSAPSPSRDDPTVTVQVRAVTADQADVQQAATAHAALSPGSGPSAPAGCSTPSWSSSCSCAVFAADWRQITEVFFRGDLIGRHADPEGLGRALLNTVVYTPALRLRPGPRHGAGADAAVPASRRTAGSRPSTSSSSAGCRRSWCSWRSACCRWPSRAWRSRSTPTARSGSRSASSAAAYMAETIRAGIQAVPQGPGRGGPVAGHAGRRGDPQDRAAAGVPDRHCRR